MPVWKNDEERMDMASNELDRCELFDLSISDLEEAKKMREAKQ